jgi:plasmid segregation protein ParM
MEIGIDLGYHNTKAVASDRRTSFPSAVGSPNKANFSLSADSNTKALLEPTHVLVGEQAVNQSRFVNRREDREWIESDEYLCLLYRAITDVTTATMVNANIVTGLPVAFYKDKKILEEHIRGEHRPRREGRRAQRIRIDKVRIIPQPFGTLLSVTLNDQGQIADTKLAVAAVGIIDVGGKTTNILSVQRLSEITRETTSINIGGWTLVRAVRDWLSDTCPGLDDLRDHQIAAAIRRRQIRYYGEPVAEFPSLVDELSAEMAQQIVAEIGHLWNGGATLDKILITGGGALMLGEHLRHHWRHAHIVDNPIYANAIGYWKLARRLYTVKR